MIDWKFYMGFAYKVAQNSKDPSTQNAALLVDLRKSGNKIILGSWNRFTKNVQETPEKWERPLKYNFIEHAERNVLYLAAKYGIVTDGLVMVCPWAACVECARAIVETGIEKLVVHKPALDKSPERWKEKIEFAFDEILLPGGVEIVKYPRRIGKYELRHSGELWTP